MTNLDSVVPEDALTSEQFQRLLRRLDDHPGRAGEKYELVRWKLVKFFQWSSYSAAEELADQTLNRVARKLGVGAEEIEDVVAFTWGVAKNIRMEARKKNFRTIGLGDVPNQSLASDAGSFAEALHRKIECQKELQRLHQCLGRLPDGDRAVFLAYRLGSGHSAEDRHNVAKRFGMTPGALRVRINRLRKKLEKCVDRGLGEHEIPGR